MGTLTISNAISGAIYYVDATNGNDSGAGISAATPWKTIAKVNSVTFNAGDLILFKSGETWYEQLTITLSGSASAPITFGKYGSGENPLIDTTVAFSGWSEYKAGLLTPPMRIWQGTYDLGGSLKPWGVIEDGTRKASKYKETADLPENVLTDETFTPQNNSATFYYRKDSGAPGTTRIGARMDGIYLNGAHFIIIDGIDVTGTSASVSSIAPRGPIYIEETSSDITIRNLTVSNTDQVGIDNGYWSTVAYGADNVDIINVICYGCNDGFYIRGTGSVINCTIHDVGLNLYDTGDRNAIGIQRGVVLVEGNEIYNIANPSILTASPDYAVSVFEPTESVTIIRNYIHDISSGPMQFYSSTGAHADNHLVANNIVSNYGNGAYAGQTTGKQAFVRITRTSDVKIYNNTILNSGTSQEVYGVCARYSAQNLKIKNNIFYSNRKQDIYIDNGTDVTGWECDYNSFYRTDFANAWFYKTSYYSTLANWRIATSQDAHSVNTDPTFISSSDYHLQSGSPCRNTGTNTGAVTKDYDGTTVPKGAGYDMGALEYVE